MINRLLSYNYSAVLIFLFVLIIKVILFYSGVDFTYPYQASIINFSGISHFWSGFLAALFDLSIGLIILLITDHYAKKTEFSLWIVLIFVVLKNFYGFYGFDPTHIGLLAFVGALMYLFHGLHIQDKRRMVIDCFNLSFILAIGSFFTPHLIYLIPMFWISRLLDGNFFIKSWIASFLGLALPFIIVDSIIFSFFSENAEFSTHYLIHQLSSSKRTFSINAWSWTQLAHIGPLILLIISLFITFSNTLSTKIITRRYNKINAFILVYLIILAAIGQIPLQWTILMMYVPASYFFSNLQIHNNHRWRRAVIIVLMLSAALSYPPIMDKIIRFVSVFF